MKRFKVICVLLLLWALANGQRKCGTEFDFQRYKSDPAFRLQEQEYQRMMQAKLKAMQPTPSAEGVVKIPVVVHVLYNYSFSDPSNISLEQILNQLNILNNDFRKRNADWTSTPLAFRSLVADIEIEFCLATVDPSGNPTGGVTRTRTDSLIFRNRNAPKRSSLGGKDGWDATKYLNIWVVPNPDDLLGYATFPFPSAGIYDGVVVGNKFFGSIGTANFPGNVYNLGRTCTHEVGHWLGLRHIWGDEELCENDDGINDTPLQGDKNFGRPVFPLLDVCQTSGNGVMFMNYMDYVNDTAMFMFTAAQKNLMRFSGSAYRSVIWSGAGADCSTCVPFSTLTGLIFNTDRVYKVSLAMSSTQSLFGNGTKIYQGASVTMLPGFNAIAAADGKFVAEVKDCTTY